MGSTLEEIDSQGLERVNSSCLTQAWFPAFKGSSSQLSVTPVVGYLASSLASKGISTQTCMQAKTHVHKNKHKNECLAKEIYSHVGIKKDYISTCLNNAHTCDSVTFEVIVFKKYNL